MSKKPARGLSAVVVNRAELLPWEREALQALRTLSVGGRELMVSTCGFMAIREAEHKTRPNLRLINGGQA